MARSVMIVSSKREKHIALMWFSMIGDVAGSSAVRRTEKEYAGDPDVVSTQPTIFLGDMKSTRMMTAGLPTVFAAHGAVCRMAKRQASVIVNWPNNLKEVDARTVAQRIARETEEQYGNRRAMAFANKMPIHPGTERQAKRSRQRDAWDQSLNFIKTYSGGDLVADTASGWETRKAYLRVVQAYAAARFVSDYLSDLMAD